MLALLAFGCQTRLLTCFIWPQGRGEPYYECHSKLIELFPFCFSFSEKLSKPRRQRQRHKIEGLIGRTIAVHVRYKSLHISLPSTWNDQVLRANGAANFSYFNSPLWKRVIAWERSHAASGYGIIWGDADRNKQEEFSAECHSVDCSGDSKVLTELQIAIKSRLLF